MLLWGCSINKVSMDQHLRGFLLLIGLDLLLSILCAFQKKQYLRFATWMFIAWALINSLVYHWISDHQFKSQLAEGYYNQHLSRVFEWNLALDCLYIVISGILLTFSRKAKKKRDKAAWRGLAIGMAFNGLYLLVLDLKFYLGF